MTMVTEVVIVNAATTGPWFHGSRLSVSGRFRTRPLARNESSDVFQAVARRAACDRALADLARRLLAEASRMGATPDEAIAVVEEAARKMEATV